MDTHFLDQKGGWLVENECKKLQIGVVGWQNRYPMGGGASFL